MRSPARKAVAEHRKRLKERGLVRIELRAPKEDAPLLREVAGTLADPLRAPAARLVLRELAAVQRAKGFKELLAAAPLEGVDLERNRDTGRDIDFDL
jgi:hypothetical protein